MSNPEFEAIAKQARQYYEAGQYDVAASAFSQALKVAPRDNLMQFSLYFVRAWCYLQADEPEKALADANKAVQMDGSRGEGFYARGWAYATLNKFREAEADLQRAKQLGMDVDEQLEAVRQARAQRVVGWGVLGASIAGKTVWNMFRQSWKEYGPK
ncbi:MAG: tetratricopeptide repeat protein [Anaerolineae bacterium]|nr:tetratricopeptide repeat protein [Anaerolineae bacterium]